MLLPSVLHEENTLPTMLQFVLIVIQNATGQNFPARPWKERWEWVAMYSIRNTVFLVHITQKTLLPKALVVTLMESFSVLSQQELAKKGKPCFLLCLAP